VDACRLSGATTVVFRHNDTDHLQELMRRSRGRKIVITEGIFSMDGDMGKLSEIKSVADHHDAITIIDDAHGDFIFGPTFSGMPAKMGVNFDIHVSSMSKALGCFGGYVATTFPIRELLINTSRQFIYRGGRFCSSDSVSDRQKGFCSPQNFTECHARPRTLGFRGCGARKSGQKDRHSIEIFLNSSLEIKFLSFKYRIGTAYICLQGNLR
jgi:hypothetical protein